MGLLAHRFWFFARQVSLWMHGIVFWLLQSFIYLLLLQPVMRLSFSQKMGLFWGITTFANFSLIWQMLTKNRLVWCVESQRLSTQVLPIWLNDLLGFWFLYALVIFFSMPLAGFLYALEWDQVLFLYFIWLVTSPMFMMQIYLSRMVALFMYRGMIISLVVLTPWVIPGVLLVVACLDAYVTDALHLQRVCLLIGISMGFSLIAYVAINQLMRRCYHHLYLE